MTQSKSLIVGLAAGCLAGAVQAQTSRFDTGVEGWSALGDVAGSLNWSPSLGNPGGTVFINDAVTGGTTYFVAPAAFLGDKHGAIGSLLRYDLMQDYPGSPNQFDDPDVVLIGAGLTLVYDTPNNPVNKTWTSYAVPLSAAGWRVGSLTGAAATPTQFLAVMNNLQGLRIRAEFQTGADTDYLDNVILSVPEPPPAAMSAAGLALLGLLRRRRMRG